MKRRGFLSMASAGALALSSGCVGLSVKADPSEQSEQTESESAGWEVSLSEQSTYFSSAEYRTEDLAFPFGSTSELVVQIKPDTPETLSAVVLMIDGSQAEYSTVNTGETQTAFEVYFEDDDDVERNAELLAVKGGEENWSEWEGGEILERVALTVEKA